LGRRRPSVGNIKARQGSSSRCGGEVSLTAQIRALKGRRGIYIPTRNGAEEEHLAQMGSIERIRSEVTVTALQAMLLYAADLLFEGGRDGAVSWDSGIQPGRAVEQGAGAGVAGAQAVMIKTIISELKSL